MHPYLMPHVSSIASPNQIIGSIAKNYLGKKSRKSFGYCVVSIMPCALKNLKP